MCIGIVCVLVDTSLFLSSAFEIKSLGVREGFWLGIWKMQN